MADEYRIREICGDWALDIPRPDLTGVLIFNSRVNAELVKAILEHEDAHPNQAVPFHPTPIREPLTLERLREMDGKPVWIVEYPDWGHWELSEDAGDYIADRDTDLYGLTYPDPEGRAGLHKLGWLAYRYPPVATDTDVGSKLDVWEPCDECRNKCCFNCLYDNLSMQSEPCNSCDGDKWETKHLFCPNCGRPLTPEACAMQEKRLRGRK